MPTESGIAGDAAEKEFSDSPRDQKERWQAELEAARAYLKPWQDEVDEAINHFLDQRLGDEKTTKRLNIFTSNVQMKRAMLFGRVPQCDVDRRFQDSTDEEGRVAALIMQRHLNTDIERDSDGFVVALDLGLMDRELAGFAQARVMYRAEMETIAATQEVRDETTGEVTQAAQAARSVKRDEEADIVYIHHRDQLWSPCRVPHELRWWAFKAELSRKELRKRFTRLVNPDNPADKRTVGDVVPLNVKTGRTDDEKKVQPWKRAEIWEIWDKETKNVYWYSEEYPEVLDLKPDPYGLENFWPFPRPRMANATTSKLVPRTDFHMAKDQYVAVNNLTNRMALLQDVVRAAGLYDKSAGETIGRLVEGSGNLLLPVENWQMFAKAGGIDGLIDWLPLEQIVKALAVIREQRAQEIDDADQVSGLADIVRGQSGDQEVTATEQGIKGRFGSVRLTSQQNETAGWATDLLKLKGELISKLFDPATIMRRANVKYLPQEDQARVGAAIQLIKDRFASFRIQVKTESISMEDYVAGRQESTEVIGALSEFVTAAAPFAQSVPGAMPFLLKIFQWALAKMKGSKEIEGIFDQAILTAASTPPPQGQQQPNPMQDPKVVAQQIKGQQDMAKTQAELRGDVLREQVKVQADAAREANQRIENVNEAREKAAITAAEREVARDETQQRPRLLGVRPSGLGPLGGGT